MAKFALRQLANVIIFGVLTGIHTVAIGALANNASNLGLLTVGILLLTCVFIAAMIALMVRNVRASRDLAKETVNNITDTPGRFADDTRQSLTAVPETIRGNMPFAGTMGRLEAEDEGFGTHTGNSGNVQVAYREQPLPGYEPMPIEPIDPETGGRPEPPEDGSSKREQIAQGLSIAETVATATGQLEVTAGLEVANRLIAPDRDSLRDNADNADNDVDMDLLEVVDDQQQPIEPARPSWQDNPEWDTYDDRREAPATDDNAYVPVSGRQVEIDVDVDLPQPNVNVAAPNVDVPAAAPVVLDRQDVNVDVDVDNDYPIPPGSYEDDTYRDDEYFHADPNYDPADYAAYDNQSSGGQSIVINNREQVHVSLQMAGGSQQMQSDELDADGNLRPMFFRPDDDMAGVR